MRRTWAQLEASTTLSMERRRVLLRHTIAMMLGWDSVRRSSIRMMSLKRMKPLLVVSLSDLK